MFSVRNSVRLLPVIATVCAMQFMPVQAQSESVIPSGLAGGILAGGAAVNSNSFVEIARYYEQALRADPDQHGLRELAMQGNILSGNFDRAVELAEISAEEGSLSQIGSVILQADAFRRGDFNAVLTALQTGQLTGPLQDAMAGAWAELGRGSMSEALESFERILEEQSELAPFALFQKALALALVGDMERAAEILAGDSEGPVSMSRRGVVAQISILSQLGRTEDALALVDQFFGSTPDDDVAEMVAAIKASESVPFTTITSATDGMAETYFILSSALVGDRNDWLPVIYGRLTLALRPDHGDAILLTAQLMERANQFQLADDIYRMMPAGDPQHLAARLGRANALFQSGETEEAIAQMQALSQERPDSVLVFSALGDMLRREERYAEAVAAYTSALALIEEIEGRHWVLLYMQAIALERLGEWDRAEPVFRQVLEFVPDEPQVLNYLGYSLIEQRRNLDEALDMIKRAVEGEPDSGYITDSLGWAFYRLGRYEEALPVMERAVELMPRDPILNDHLGDVYYAVGRYREARFQWRRALSFGPHADLDMDLVRRKLEIGKDAALKELDAAQ